MSSAPKIIFTGVLVVLLAVCGCTGSKPGRSSSPPTSTGSQQSVDRQALAQAFAADHPDIARVITEDGTRLTRISLPGLTERTLFDVQGSGTPHGRRYEVALSDAGVGRLLSGDPEACASVLAQVEGLDADRAITVAKAYLDLSRDFVTWSYRVESTDKINWVPHPDADQSKRRDRVIAEFHDQIVAPPAVPRSGGWAVTLWMVSSTDLVRHKITGSRDGRIADEATTEATELPVPQSI